MKHDFTYNNTTIPYEIIRKNVKNINIRVKPNCELVVSCNDKVDNKMIELLMLKRINWILKTIEEYKAKQIIFSDINYKLLDGEEFLILGRLLRIKNIYNKDFGIHYDNNYLYIYRKNNRNISTKFKNWHSKNTLTIYNDIASEVFKKFKKYGIEKPDISIKRMKTRWGTCNIKKSLITLNSELIKVDRFLIEYVVTHEMTHLLYKNHDKEFWSFFTSIMPDWKERETILNNIFIK